MKGLEVNIVAFTRFYKVVNDVQLIIVVVAQLRPEVVIAN